MTTKVFSPRRLIEARGRLSRFDLALTMRVREKQISRWESGANVPSANAVGAMAQATGRDIEFFYIESNGDSGEEEEAALRRRARRLLADLEPDMQAVLLGELRAARP